MGAYYSGFYVYLLYNDCVFYVQIRRVGVYWNMGVYYNKYSNFGGFCSVHSLANLLLYYIYHLEVFSQFDTTMTHNFKWV